MGNVAPRLERWSRCCWFPWRYPPSRCRARTIRWWPRWSANFLQDGHVTRPMIGDEISSRLFQRFLKDLDPGKVYFLKSDIDEFKKHETELDDMLLKGDISFAYKVYDRFLRADRPAAEAGR